MTGFAEISLGEEIVPWGYIFSYCFSVTVLVIFCVQRFDQPVGVSTEFVDRLAPRYQADRSKHSKALIVYLVLMLAFFTVACVIGPAILSIIDPNSGFEFSERVNSEDTSELFSRGDLRFESWFPLVMVMVFTGFSTRNPLLNSVELLFRGFSHRLIGIPRGVKRVAQIIDRTRLDSSHLSSDEIQDILARYEKITGDKITSFDDLYKMQDPKHELVRRWIRLTFLLRKLDNSSFVFPDGFNLEVMEKYPEIYDSIVSKIKEITDENIKKIYHLNDGDLINNNEVFVSYLSKIKIAQSNLNLLISAAIARDLDHLDSAASVFSYFGLKVSVSGVYFALNAFLFALFISAVFVFCVVGALPVIFSWIEFVPDSNDPNFPLEISKAGIWALSTVCIHGGAIWAAWSYRNRHYKKWKPTIFRKLEVPMTQHLVIALRCWLSSSSLMFILLLLLFAVNLTGPELDLPSLLLVCLLIGAIGIVTGFWFNYSIDVGLRKEDVSRVRLCLQPVYQAVATGMVVLVAMLLSQSLNPTISNDLIVYAATVAAVVGLLIGTVILAFTRRNMDFVL